MIPSRHWARARAASTSMQRAIIATSPNTPRIAGVPNMSAKIAESRIPIAMAAAALRSRRSGTVGRESRSGRGESEIGPATGHQALQRREAVLVGHLRALGDPIAEVDERPPAVPAFFDEPENAPGPEAAFRLIRRIKAVDG